MADQLSMLRLTVTSLPFLQTPCNKHENDEMMGHHFWPSLTATKASSINISQEMSDYKEKYYRKPRLNAMCDETEKRLV